MKILIIEDEPKTRKELLSVLNTPRDIVIVTENGHEALKILEDQDHESKEDTIDIVIAGVNITGISGLDLCRYIRSKEKFYYIYFILLAPLHEKKEIIQGFDAGADEYIIKPYDLEILTARIEAGKRIVTLGKKYQWEHNLTSRYANEMEKLAAEKALQLVRKDRLYNIGTLSAGIAHEISNPATLLSGNINLMEKIWPSLTKYLSNCPENEPDSKKIKFISTEMPGILKGFKNSVTHISQIISTLKYFVRQEKVRFSPVDINNVVNKALELCLYIFKYHFDIKKDFFEGLPKINGNFQQLEQVLVHLFINAADAMQNSTEKHLKIKTHLNCQAIEISIEDSGKGVNSNLLEKIWEPFFTTKQDDNRIGLGLSICKDIIEDHGGIISVTNNDQNNGCTFKINLPFIG